MKRYFRLYSKFLQQYIKSLMEYRIDFIFGLIGFILIRLAEVVFIKLIFNFIPTLSGWNINQILFIYGLAQIPKGIDHVFTDYLWIFSWKTIARGEFDRYLLRPLNPLFQVISESFQPDGFGEIIVGIALFIISSVNLNLVFSFDKIIELIVVIIFATLIYTAVKLATTSIAFWVKFAQAHVFMAYQVSSFAKYPIGIYPGAIRFVLTFLIPFAFTGYYPGAYFLGNGSFLTGVVLTVLVGIISISLAYCIWLKGITVYESSGN